MTDEIAEAVILANCTLRQRCGDAVLRDTADKLARAVLALSERCEVACEQVAALNEGCVAYEHELERMRPVYEAAMRWHRSGTNPCGDELCCCTECVLWAATTIASTRTTKDGE